MLERKGMAVGIHKQLGEQQVQEPWRLSQKLGGKQDVACVLIPSLYEMYQSSHSFAVMLITCLVLWILCTLLVAEKGVEPLLECRNMIALTRMMKMRKPFLVFLGWDVSYVPLLLVEIVIFPFLNLYFLWVGGWGLGCFDDIVRVLAFFFEAVVSCFYFLWFFHLSYIVAVHQFFIFGWASFVNRCIIWITIISEKVKLFFGRFVEICFFLFQVHYYYYYYYYYY